MTSTEIQAAAERIANIALENLFPDDESLNVYVSSTGMGLITSELAKLLPRWIPTEEQLPEFGSKVNGYSPEYGQRETIFDRWPEGSIARINHPEEGYFSWYEPQNHWTSSWKVTHWQPLPEPPEAK